MDRKCRKNVGNSELSCTAGGNSYWKYHLKSNWQVSQICYDLAILLLCVCVVYVCVCVCVSISLYIFPPNSHKLESSIVCRGMFIVAIVYSGTVEMKSGRHQSDPHWRSTWAKYGEGTHHGIVFSNKK